MKRNCNLELRLVTPSVFYRRPDHVKGQYNSMLDMEGDSPNEKQLSIFYSGRIVTCDATELQARAIIWLASREMEQTSGKQSGSDPLSPLLNSFGYSPRSGLSMKRSLQRFLQKRKTRAQATSPYSHHQNSYLTNEN